MQYADLSGANLARAGLDGANLSSAYLPGANLSNANLNGAKLGKATATSVNFTGADLTGAELRGANLTWSTWTDGAQCDWGSIGRCLTGLRSPSVSTITVSSLTPLLFVPEETGSGLQSAPARLTESAPEDLILAARYFLLFEGERPLIVIETKGLTVTVIEGVLRYGVTYQFIVLDVSTTNELMDAVGPISFTTPAKPEDEDDYGNPLIAQGLKDAQGQPITLDDNKLSTLITAGASLLSQQGMLTAIQDAGGAMKDGNGATLATINTNDVRVVHSKGGQGKEVVMAASGANLMATIKPLTASGHSMDKSGNLKTDVTIAPSNISFPLGFFDFSVSLVDVDNDTDPDMIPVVADVVIVPPAPFAPETRWYKVQSDGTLQEYPNFRVDASGNGILTLYDDDEWDLNPAFGIIRDPGGPGVPSEAPGVSSEGGSSSGGCFIATTAHGPLLRPFFSLLRSLRDAILPEYWPGR